ncbi:hypothetical protein ACFV3E_46360 [Streptomyces sp. NPDC059718]
MVGEPSGRDEDFPTWWDDHGIERRTNGVTHFLHPVVGELALPLHCVALAVTGGPDRILGVCTAEPATASDRALRRRAQWAEQSGPTGPVI